MREQRDALQAAVAQAEQKDWVASRSERLAKWTGGPEWLRFAVRRPADKPLPDADLEKAGVFAEEVLQTSEIERVMEVLFPKLAKEFGRAAARLAELPFRSPSCGLFPMLARDESTLKRIRAAWLAHACDTLKGYDPDIAWLVAHQAYMPMCYASIFNELWAAAIHMGGPDGERMLHVATSALGGSTDGNTMVDNAISSLLMSGHPDGVAAVERLLLAAQRQEGVRSAVLASTFGAQPDVVLRMLRVVVDERLTRFTSVAMSVYESLGLDPEESRPPVHELARSALQFMESPERCQRALAGRDPDNAYLALWALAWRGWEQCMDPVRELVRRKEPVMRVVGVEVAARLRHPDSVAIITSALADENINVVAAGLAQMRVVDALTSQREHDAGEDITSICDCADESKASARAKAFSALQGVFSRLPKKAQPLKPLSPLWPQKAIEAKDVAGKLVELCPADRVMELLPLLDHADGWRRPEIVAKIIGRSTYERYREPGEPAPQVPPLAPEHIHIVVGLLNDRASHGRERAERWLESEPVTPLERDTHEQLLRREAADIRGRAVKRLLKQSDSESIASARRLLAGVKAQASAGLEILKQMVQAGRSVEEVQQVTREAAPIIAKLGGDSKASAQAILEAPKVRQASDEVAPTVANAFGLAADELPLTAPSPRRLPVDAPTPAAIACIWSLAAFVEASATREIDRRSTTSSDDPPRLLGSFGSSVWYGPRPSAGRSRAQNREEFVLADDLDTWFDTRPDSMRDADGLELVRALVYCAWIAREKAVSPIHDPRYATKQRPDPRQYMGAIRWILEWLLWLRAPRAHDFLLDQMETAIAAGLLVRTSSEDDDHDRDDVVEPPLTADEWYECWTDGPFRHDPAPTLDQLARLRDLHVVAAPQWAALVDKHKSNDEYGVWLRRRWITREPLKPGLNDYARLWADKRISDGEMMSAIVSADRTESLLDRSSRRYPPANQTLTIAPGLADLVERLRQQIIKIELQRGELETPASEHARLLDPSGGLDVLVPAAVALGKSKLARSSLYWRNGRVVTLSAMIRNSRPGASDTPEAFANVVREAGLGEQRLVELAVYQPRWAEHVEHTLAWPGFAEAVLWVLAHTKETSADAHDDDDKDDWQSRVEQLTPIPKNRRNIGAVDRAWFERVHQRLGPERWQSVYEAAKYACSGAAHTRVRLFADAMLGDVSEAELLRRITRSRNQDACRALGLLAVKPGPAGKAQVLKRFQVLQEMRRTSRKHGGSMLQQSEKHAVEIGMENLAWTAGYPDPLRLQWAMEIEEFGDLAKGAVTVKSGDTAVTLSVDEEGLPAIVAKRKDKVLKSIPPAVRKQKAVAELAERATMLRRQVSRVRQALEQAMIRGDSWSGGELIELFGHPLLKPMLRRVVLVAQTRAGSTFLGYPDRGGKVLRSFDGSVEPVRGTDTLRVAHPLDLLASKTWHGWQAECFSAERVQPFKQVFREVYLPVEAELAGRAEHSNRSSRYAGQQVNPKQALALFGTRGWVASWEDGVQRTDHQSGITAWMAFAYAFGSFADGDGLTLSHVEFVTASNHKPVPVRQVPPRLFSEWMRDLDLVVSVAHLGGVDPEASLSTIDMRATLLRETCALLSLSNVELDGPRAIIQGVHARYALHLGSGTIHLLPGGTLWVVPVHSQYRGRVFLPFADNDPKTAEIMSKALLLARDSQIVDPSILVQLRR